MSAVLLGYSVVYADQKGGNEPLIRIQPSSGSFKKITTITKQIRVIKAIASVERDASNNGTVGPTTTVVEMGGSWATPAEARAAFTATYDRGEYSIVSPISTFNGDEKEVARITIYLDENERSSAKTQRQIAANAKEGWSFLEWVGESPPKCEIEGTVITEMPTTNAANDLIKYYKTTTNYSWTANWKESKPK